MELHPDAIYEARMMAREELTRNVKEAAKLMRLLNVFGVDLMAKKVDGIKHLRECLGISLVDAKDAWLLAYELRYA